MIPGYGSVFQTLLATLFTWGLTALGASLVFIFQSGQRKILDGSLGFAAGVMTAASYWSLLAPAIEMAEQSGSYGQKGQWAFIPVAVGFLLGAIFVYAADILMPYLGSSNPLNIALEMEKSSSKFDKDGYSSMEACSHHESQSSDYEVTSSFSVSLDDGSVVDGSARQRRNPSFHDVSISDNVENNIQDMSHRLTEVNWKRILLLIVAITIHNIPEGLAVGVGFGAIGKTPSATFENARNLAIGIGIQNFPEGLAVSLPLRGSGMSTLKSFWYGQLSGVVEPIAGLFGAFAISIAEPILPYALAFAAGAMIYVVVDDIIPEAQMCGNGKLATWCSIVGFITMMSLDVGLG